MNLKGIISKVAPMIGSAMGGPFGGVAVSAALSALGIESKDPKSDEIALMKAVERNPEWAFKLKEAENAFQSKMAELGIKEEEIASADRDSARKRQVATGDKTPQVLA